MDGKVNKHTQTQLRMLILFKELKSITGSRKKRGNRVELHVLFPTSCLVQGNDCLHVIWIIRVVQVISTFLFTCGNHEINELQTI